MNIETSRMVVRNFEMKDVNDLQEILGDAETMKYCEPAYSLAKTTKFLQNFSVDKKGAVAAALKETGKIIGYILFNEISCGVYEIGWIFNRGYQGQGYAFEACKAVADYAFDHLKVRKIFAETIDIKKSVNLMLKLGMKLEGVERGKTVDNLGNRADLYTYSICAEDRR